MALAEHINAAFRVLKHSFNTITGLFTDKEICIMDYLRKEQNNKAIEIRFDTVTICSIFASISFFRREVN